MFLHPVSTAWHRRLFGLGVFRRAFCLQFPLQRTLPGTISILDILYCLFFLRVLFSIRLAYIPDHGLSFFQKKRKLLQLVAHLEFRLILPFV